MSEATRLLRELVRIPSINPSAAAAGEPAGEGELASFIAGYLRAAGVECELQEILPGRPNVIAVLEGDGSGALALEAHTDTVSGQGMERDPFDPGDDCAIIRGRGSCDDKASLAAMLVAVVRAAKEGSCRRGCLFAATADEEYRFTGVRVLLQHGPPLALRGAVVGEPTGLGVICAHKGAARFRVTALGRTAHSSTPAAGENAIYHGAHIVAAVKTYAEDLTRRPPHPLVGPPTCAATIIHGGTAINVVPDACAVDVDRRVLPGESLERIAEEFRHVIAQCVGGRFAYRIEDLLLDAAMETLPDDPLVCAALQTVREVCGSASVGGVAYGTNASKFAALGIPAVVLGPGDIAQAHTADEWVSAEQVEQAAQVYYRLLTHEDR